MSEGRAPFYNNEVIVKENDVISIRINKILKSKSSKIIIEEE